MHRFWIVDVFLIVIVVFEACELHIRGGELRVRLPSPGPVVRWLLVVLSLIPVWVLEELLIVIEIFATSEILIRVILLLIGRNRRVIHGPVVIILILEVPLVPVVVLEMVFLLVLHVLVAIELIVHLIPVLLEPHVVLIILILVSWRVLI